MLQQDLVGGLLLTEEYIFRDNRGVLRCCFIGDYRAGAVWCCRVGSHMNILIPSITSSLGSIVTFESFVQDAVHRTLNDVTTSQTIDDMTQFQHSGDASFERCGITPSDTWPNTSCEGIVQSVGMPEECGSAYTVET